ncbi:hypothetical protein J6590_028633 [Homalodisca vitripennis]|nr:hypothetical protein J6590_028633 [Homalodisca vitripennis]
MRISELRQKTCCTEGRASLQVQSNRIDACIRASSKSTVVLKAVRVYKFSLIGLMRISELRQKVQLYCRLCRVSLQVQSNRIDVYIRASSKGIVVLKAVRVYKFSLIGLMRISELRQKYSCTEGRASLQVQSNRIDVYIRASSKDSCTEAVESTSSV